MQVKGTRGEFNNASVHGRSLFWHLSLFIKFKACHQYNECPRVLALLNSPQVKAHASRICHECLLYKVS